MKPLVSIIVPVYNGSNYLREAIDSALAQTYTNTEILVVNDGSTDGGKTEAIALSYGDRIRYFRKENGGVATALNTGIREMRGEYFSWLSHDDAYLPDKILSQVEYLKKTGNKAVVTYTDFAYINETSEETGTFRADAKMAANRFLAILSTSIHGCSLLVPKACFEKAGLFSEKLRTTQDNEMWLRIAKAGFDFVRLPRVLVKSRRHSEQGQLKLRDVNVRETEEFYLWAVDFIWEEIEGLRPEVIRLLGKRRQKEAAKMILERIGTPAYPNVISRILTRMKLWLA